MNIYTLFYRLGHQFRSIIFPTFLNEFEPADLEDLYNRYFFMEKKLLEQYVIILFIIIRVSKKLVAILRYSLWLTISLCYTILPNESDIEFYSGGQYYTLLFSQDYTEKLPFSFIMWPFIVKDQD